MKSQKKKRYFKGMAALLLMVVMALSGTVCAYALEVPPGAEFPSSPAKKGDLKEADTTASDLATSIQGIASTQDTSYFKKGSTYIEYLGNHVMCARARTFATTTIFRVTALVMLEQYKGGKWQIYRLLQHSESNDYMSTAYVQQEVPVGYYYRAEGIHITLHNGVQTRKETVTDSLWLDK